MNQYICFNRRLHSQKKGNGLCLAWQQRNTAGKSSAGIFVIAGYIPEVSGCNALWVSVSVIFSEKMIFISAVGENICTCKTEKTFDYIFMIDLFLFRKRIQIAMDSLHNTISFKQRSGNKKRVL